MDPRCVLLSSGPATTTTSVKEALMIADTCLSESALSQLYADARYRLARRVGDALQAVAIPVVGNEATSLEAAMISLVRTAGVAQMAQALEQFCLQARFELNSP